MLVQIGYPPEYEFVGTNVLSGKGFATVQLSEGEHVVHFRRQGRDFATILQVDGGGEGYVTIPSAKIIEIERVREMD